MDFQVIDLACFLNLIYQFLSCTEGYDNKAYYPKEIYNKSVTGALTSLSKQLKLSQDKSEATNKIEELQSLLVLKEKLAKNDGFDWAEAQKLRYSGKTIREIAGIIGASSSAVGKYTKKPTA